MRLLITLQLILFVQLGAFSQISFDQNQLNLDDCYSGVAINITDMNADGLDDIIRLNEAKELLVDYLQPNGQFNEIALGQVTNMNQWSMVSGDIDNNGFNDIICGDRYGVVDIAMAYDDGSGFEFVSLEFNDVFVQGSNLVDVNGDGWLDYFACHDDGPSRLWLNDGTGNLVYDNTYINFSTSSYDEDDSGNYGSVWTDFDLDGDLDLYIAKCRQGVNDPSDQRRINLLYENDGNGNFTETADQYGLKLGSQSWTADFGDIDNDGDWDCFITNHDEPSQLLKNVNGQFIDITTDANIDVNVIPIQGVFEDFDNDGWLDILVAGSHSQIFHNNGNGTYTDLGEIFSAEDMESYALGDVNRDGKIDIYGGYGNIYSTPSNQRDLLWLNNSENDNTFLNIQLETTNGNTNAIGSLIKIYGDWGVQTREIRAGESYGIMTSMSQNVGCGTSQMVDAIVVAWNSGAIEVFENIRTNQFLRIVEGSCISPDVTLDLVGNSTICQGETVTLIVTDTEAYTYLWSNGATTAEIEISTPGTYSCRVMEGTCFVHTNMITIVQSPDETPYVSAVAEDYLCSGSTLELMSNEATSYMWSTGAITQNIFVSEPGEYFVTVPGVCQEFTSVAFDVPLISLDPLTITGDVTVIENTEFELLSDMDAIWYDGDMNPLVTEPTSSLMISGIDHNETYFASTEVDIYGVEEIGGKIDTTGNGAQNNPNFIGSLIFDVYQSFVLETTEVFAFGEGERTVQLLNQFEEIVTQKTIFIADGASTIELDFLIPAGNYYQLTFQIDPQMFRNRTGDDSNIGFPYAIGNNLGSIYDTPFGTDNYYYFYNWQVREYKGTCNTPLAGHTVEVLVSSIDEFTSVSIVPNPATNLIQINTDEIIQSVEFYNLNGQLVMKKQLGLGQKSMSLNGISSGMYWMKIETQSGEVLHVKIVKH